MNRVNVVQSHTQSDRANNAIVVVGSCFLDYVGYVGRMPSPGETIHSKQFAKGFGGKGANQAVMAGRLGGTVSMVSVVGDDGDGALYIAELRKNGVAAQHCFQAKGGSTGLALIFVDQTSAQNEIVICPNSTLLLTPEYLRARTANYESFLTGARYLICQNEIPLPTTLDVLKEAHTKGIYTIFNTAPAPSAEEVKQISPFLKYVSLLCPNETEASLLTGVKVTDPQSALEAITKLQQSGVRDVVITLGSQGFVLAQGTGKAPVHVPSVRVKAVDTTGAGDCFVGSMTYFLERGISLLEACKRANQCAAISVTRKGTQSSYPLPKELSAEFFRH